MGRTLPICGHDIQGVRVMLIWPGSGIGGMRRWFMMLMMMMVMMTGVRHFTHGGIVSKICLFVLTYWGRCPEWIGGGLKWGGGEDSNGGREEGRKGGRRWMKNMQIIQFLKRWFGCIFKLVYFQWLHNAVLQKCGYRLWQIKKKYSVFNVWTEYILGRGRGGGLLDVWALLTFGKGKVLSKNVTTFFLSAAKHFYHKVFKRKTASKNNRTCIY